MQSFRYRRAHRISGQNAHAAVFKQKNRYYSRGLLVMARANQLPYMRLGLSVGKKLGKAVVRNRIKRMIREGFRQAENRKLGGLDLIVIPRDPEAFQDVHALTNRLNGIMKAAYRKLAESRP